MRLRQRRCVATLLVLRDPGVAANISSPGNSGSTRTTQHEPRTAVNCLTCVEGEAGRIITRHARRGPKVICRAGDGDCRPGVPHHDD
ncbi:hypothetical protein V8E36_007325 [Tilletia maclaganii]